MTSNWLTVLHTMAVKMLFHHYRAMVFCISICGSYLLSTYWAVKVIRKIYASSCFSNAQGWVCAKKKKKNAVEQMFALDLYIVIQQEQKACRTSIAPCACCKAGRTERTPLLGYAQEQEIDYSILKIQQLGFITFWTYSLSLVEWENITVY